MRSNRRVERDALTDKTRVLMTALAEADSQVYHQAYEDKRTRYDTKYTSLRSYTDLGDALVDKTRVLMTALAETDSQVRLRHVC